MTLGGLALAVGILVDDATVTIENINYHLEQGKDVETAILDGAHQIALPALVSTLSICIVFVPMFLLAGIAKFLFIPLAEAVVFAMLASYLLSRTLVPTLAKFWLKKQDERPQPQKSALWRAFRRRFERALRAHARRLPQAAGASPSTAARASPRFSCSRWRRRHCWPFRWARCPASARTSSRRVDAGQIKLHLRARTGTRIEETAVLCDEVERTIRETIPPSEITSIVDNLGLPYSGINLAYSTSAPVGPGDADIFVNLAEEALTRSRLSARAAHEAGGHLSLDAIRVPAGRHHQPDPEFRPALADRRAGRRQRMSRAIASSSTRCCRSSSSVAGRGRPAHSAALRLSAVQRRCRPQQGPIARSDRAERRDQPAGIAVGQLPDVALLLDRSEERHAIQRRLADAAISPARRSTISAIRRSADGRCHAAAGGTSQILSNVATIHRSVAPAVVSHYNAQTGLRYLSAPCRAPIWATSPRRSTK